MLLLHFFFLFILLFYYYLLLFLFYHEKLCFFNILYLNNSLVSISLLDMTISILWNGQIFTKLRFFTLAITEKPLDKRKITKKLLSSFAARLSATTIITVPLKSRSLPFSGEPFFFDKREGVDKKVTKNVVWKKVCSKKNIVPHKNYSVYFL